MSERKISPVLLVLVVLFVSFLIMSNVLANHMLQIWFFVADAGWLTFPITYILSDVFSEVYGYKWSRRVAYMAAAINFVFAMLIMLAVRLPQPDWYDGSIFQTAVGSSMRIVVASLISYVAGDFVNDIIFRNMKKKHTDLQGFKLRAILSSFGGQAVDTCLFIFIAFTGVVPQDEMWTMIWMGVLLKVAYEIVILPVTEIVARKVQFAEDKFSVSYATVSKIREHLERELIK